MKSLKNIVVLVVVVIVVLGLGFFGKAYFDAKEIAAEPDVFERNTDEVKMAEFEDGEYLVDLGMSNFAWQASKVLIDGYTDKGEISLSNGKFVIENGQFVSGDFSVDMNSIKAVSTGSGRGQEGLSNHLKSADFFDVEKFATSYFVLNSVEPTDYENKYLVYGDLTIKGVTNEINFVAEIFSTENSSIKILAETTLDRTMWGIQYGSGKFFDNLGDNVIDDNFGLEFELTALKK